MPTADQCSHHTSWRTWLPSSHPKRTDALGAASSVAGEMQHFIRKAGLVPSCSYNPIIPGMTLVFSLKTRLRECPGGLMVRIQHFYCRGPGSIPGWGTEIPQAMRHAKILKIKKKKKKKKNQVEMLGVLTSIGHFWVPWPILLLLTGPSRDWKWWYESATKCVWWTRRRRFLWPEGTAGWHSNGDGISFYWLGWRHKTFSCIQL